MALSVSTSSFGKKVRVISSDERGEIAAFSRSRNLKQPQFLVEYVAADGRATEAWFFASQIEEVQA